MLKGAGEDLWVDVARTYSFHDGQDCESAHRSGQGRFLRESLPEGILVKGTTDRIILRMVEKRSMLSSCRTQKRSPLAITK